LMQLVMTQLKTMTDTILSGRINSHKMLWKQLSRTDFRSNAFTKSFSPLHSEIIVEENASLKSHEIITRNLGNFHFNLFRKQWRERSTKNSHYSPARRNLKIIYQLSLCEFCNLSIIFPNEFLMLNVKLKMKNGGKVQIHPWRSTSSHERLLSAFRFG
jgi:hypothetical protein